MPTAQTGQACDLKLEMQALQVNRFGAIEAILDMLPRARDLWRADTRDRATLAPPWISGLGARNENRLAPNLLTIRPYSSNFKDFLQTEG